MKNCARDSVTIDLMTDVTTEAKGGLAKRTMSCNALVLFYRRIG